MRLGWLAVVFLALSGAASAGGAEFDRVVKGIESHYGARHVHIPLMGVANFLVTVARPEGVSGFKLAVFDHLDAAPVDGGHAELDRLIGGLCGKNLRPLVEAHSRGDSTYILAGESGNNTRMLIATFGRSSATVIEVRANMQVLLRMLREPEHAGREFGAGNGR